MYLIPCTKKGDEEQLLLLPTKYGAVVFAFKDPDGVLPPFLQVVSASVKEGYRLVVRREDASDDEELLQRVKAEIDRTQPFIVAIEGTPMGERLLDEFGDGTLWQKD